MRSSEKDVTITNIIQDDELEEVEEDDQVNAQQAEASDT